MAAYIKYYQFIENVFKGVHNFTSDGTSTLMVALSNTAGDIVQTVEVLASVTEISYTFCSTRVFANVTCEQTTGTVALAADDLVLTASGGTVGPFQYVIVYDDDPTSPLRPLVCCFDYGSAVTLQDTETFTINLPTNLFTAT